MPRNSITREQTERCLQNETRTVRFEVTYHGCADTITYDKIHQINFENVRKLTLVFPKGHPLCAKT